MTKIPLINIEHCHIFQKELTETFSNRYVKSWFSNLFFWGVETGVGGEKDG